jgi:hypothetical protein
VKSRAQGLDIHDTDRCACVKNIAHVSPKADIPSGQVAWPDPFTVEFLWFFERTTKKHVKSVKKVTGIPQLGVMTLSNSQYLQDQIALINKKHKT